MLTFIHQQPLEPFMNKYLLSVGLILFLFACKDNKKTIQAGEIATAADFVAFYPEVELPFSIADTNLVMKQKDSNAIEIKTFSQFIPDSIWRKDFGKTATPKFYALGRAVEKEKERYLF